MHTLTARQASKELPHKCNTNDYLNPICCDFFCPVEWEAVALFDYVARSPAELSFKQGDPVILYSKASCDWWRGEVGGVKGLVPHKYISILEA